MANTRKRVTIFKCNLCRTFCSLTDGYEFSGLDSGSVLKKRKELRDQGVCPTKIASSKPCPLCAEDHNELWRTPATAYLFVSRKRLIDDAFGDKGIGDY